MRCHNCRHHEAIQRGEYDSKPWNELPCATCSLGEDTFFSIPFEEDNPPDCFNGGQSHHPYSNQSVLAARQARLSGGAGH
jgi:hypothetical protein